MKDLWRWARDPLSLLERGASAGSVFRLRLWRPIFVGYRPAWNETVLSDPETFQDQANLGEQPVLGPEQDRAMATAVAEMLPRHDFDAVKWSRDAVRVMLDASGRSAPHETIAHTLAWAIWLLGEHSRWQEPPVLPRVIDEVLRLHPPVWLGTRLVTRDVVLDGVPLKRKSIVGYSPYLTHRDPSLWPGPAEFRPDRFAKAPRSWSYLPFGGDGGGFAETLTRHMLMTALVPLSEKGLTAMRGEAGGPLWVIPGLRAQLLFRRSAA